MAISAAAAAAAGCSSSGSSSSSSGTVAPCLLGWQSWQHCWGWVPALLLPAGVPFDHRRLAACVWHRRQGKREVKAKPKCRSKYSAVSTPKGWSHGDHSCSSSSSSSGTVARGALPAGVAKLAALLGLGACTAAASGWGVWPSASCSLHMCGTGDRAA
jgi:hypothetical protein